MKRNQREIEREARHRTVRKAKEIHALRRDDGRSIPVRRRLQPALQEGGQNPGFLGMKQAVKAIDESRERQNPARARPTQR